MISVIQDFADVTNEGLTITFSSKIIRNASVLTVFYVSLTSWILLALPAVIELLSGSLLHLKDYLIIVGVPLLFGAGFVYASMALFVSVFTLVFNIDQKTYKMSCGVTPIKFARSGKISEIQRVDIIRVVVSPDGILPRVPMRVVRVIWCDRRVPYIVVGNAAVLATIKDSDKAEEFGRQLSEKLGVPFVSEVANKIVTSRSSRK